MGEFWEIYTIAGRRIPKHQIVGGFLASLVGGFWLYSKLKSDKPAPPVFDSPEEKAFVEDYKRKALENMKQPAYLRGATH